MHLLLTTGEVHNQATFETLEEARVSGPAEVKAYWGNADFNFISHPALDFYPKETTYIYRSAERYGGRAAARMNTVLIVFAEEHFETKDLAKSYLKDAGIIDIIDESIGSIILITPIGEKFALADASAYYYLQTAMLSHNSATIIDGVRYMHAEPAYFGGYGYLYAIGVDGGATFFNNYIATIFDYVSRLSSVLLINGKIDEIRKIPSCIPAYLVNTDESVVSRYKAANMVDATQGKGDVVIYYNQAYPLRQVYTVNTENIDLASIIKTAYSLSARKQSELPLHHLDRAGNVQRQAVWFPTASRMGACY